MNCRLFCIRTVTLSEQRPAGCLGYVLVFPRVMPFSELVWSPLAFSGSFYDAVVVRLWGACGAPWCALVRRGAPWCAVVRLWCAVVRLVCMFVEQWLRWYHLCSLCVAGLCELPFAFTHNM